MKQSKFTEVQMVKISEQIREDYKQVLTPISYIYDRAFRNSFCYKLRIGEFQYFVVKAFCQTAYSRGLN